MKHSVKTSCHGEEGWLKGNIHVHTDEDLHEDISMDRDHGGEREWVIERSRLEPFCFDFICTSVHPYIESIDTFSEGGEREDIVVIPGRELQNDTIDNGGYEGGYFQGEAAKYLHVLTVGGEGGVSICCHPCFFESTRPRAGGEWPRIRSALLDPCERLSDLNVLGIEVYNGLSVLEEHLGARRYSPDFSEPCWDDLLCRGYRCFGFAGNDEFYREAYVYENFSPLGYLMVFSRKNGKDIVDNIRKGNFYASTGVTLGENPLETQFDGERYRFHLNADEGVKWSAVVYEENGSEFALRQEKASDVSSEWTLTLQGNWKYIRFQAESPTNSLRRAWLQPVYGPSWGD